MAKSFIFIVILWLFYNVSNNDYNNNSIKKINSCPSKRQLYTNYNIFLVALLI